MKIKILILVLSIILAAASNGPAEDIRSLAPGAVQKREAETLRYFRLEKKLKEEKKPPEKAVSVKDEPPPAPAEQAGEAVIFIKKIETNASEILSIGEVQEITRTYEGTRASINEIFEIIEKLNDLYKAKNYITAKAVLPPQKVEDGIIRIMLIEGRTGKTLVENNKYTRDSFIKDRISLHEGELVQLDELEEKIFFFNGTNDVKVKAELKPGEKFGTTDAVLNVEEPRNYNISLFSDNTGRKDVGRDRIGIYAQIRSLLGYRDALTLGGHWTEGTTSGFASYNIPVSYRGTRLSGTYNFNQIEIISGDFEELDISGEYSGTSINITHPFLVTSRYTLNGIGGFHWKTSTTDFEDVRLTETNVRSLEFGADMQFIDEKGVWYSLHTFTNGFDDFGGDKRFFKYNIDISRLHILKKDFIAIVRGSAQLADTDVLPQSEQFQIGGLATVRGYSEGLLIGDNGYLLSAELNFPLPFNKAAVFNTPLSNMVKGVIFVDHGGAFPFKGEDESIDSEDFLTSTGFGFLFDFSKHVSGRLVFGFPLHNKEDDPEGTADIRVHYQLQITAF